MDGRRRTYRSTLSLILSAHQQPRTDNPGRIGIMWSATLSDDTLLDPEPVTPNLYDPIMGYVDRRPDRPRPWRVRYRTDAAPRPPPHPRRPAHRRRRRPLRHLPTTRARLDPHHLRHLWAPVRRPRPTGRRRPRTRPDPNSRGLSADSRPIRRTLTRPLKRRNPLQITGDFETDSPQASSRGSEGI